jgi:hypothetical protein
MRMLLTTAWAGAQSEGSLIYLPDVLFEKSHKPLSRITAVLTKFGRNQ